MHKVRDRPGYGGQRSRRHLSATRCKFAHIRTAEPLRLNLTAQLLRLPAEPRSIADAQRAGKLSPPLKAERAQHPACSMGSIKAHFWRNSARRARQVDSTEHGRSRRSRRQAGTCRNRTLPVTLFDHSRAATVDVSVSLPRCSPPL